MQTPSSPAPLMPAGPISPVRKIGPAGPEYDRRVVTVARELTMDARGRVVERVVSTLGARRSFDQDDRLDGVVHRSLIAVQ